MKYTYVIGGTVFGKWHIERKVGAGNFGTVYEIRRKEFGETYTAALKVITVPQGETEFQDALDEGMTRSQAEDYFYTMVKDIVQEFAIMAKLKGTGNVVSYEDHEVVPHEGGGGWDILIRMELLNPLMPYAYDHPLSRRDVIRLGIDMCKALELCQRYNIIHRDIKPENIFVSDNGDFKLGDFGIARTIERTMSGLSKKGTYNYMAPEVYRGGEYGFSVDIYSLGIVLYRLLNNNRAPFLPQPPEPITYSQREAALAKRMGGEELPPPVNGRGRLGEIVLKACAFDPRARYSSPVQMRQELEAIQYSPEDGKVIYPSGDELALYEHPYASRRSQEENSAPELFAAPVPVAAEVTEKTESVFGGGAVNSPAPEKAPEDFFTPVGGEPEEFWPEEGTEKTESIFGHGPEEPDPAEFAPDPGEGQAEKPKKSKRRKILIAAVAALLCIPVVFFLMYQDVFGVLMELRMPPVPETVQSDLDDFDGDLGWSCGPFGKLTDWFVYVRSDDNTELLAQIEYDRNGNRVRAESYGTDGTLEVYSLYEYDHAGNCVREETYDANGALEEYLMHEYDSAGKCLRDKHYDADGILTFYWEYEYDSAGNRVRQKDYNADGTLYYMLEYDSYGNCVREESYDADGMLENYTVYDYDSAGKCLRMEYYDANGSLEYYYVYEYDGDRRLVRREEYGANGTLERYKVYGYDSAGNRVREESYDADGALMQVDKYKSNGNIERGEFYGANGVLESYVVYECDRWGNIVRSANYDANGTLTSYWAYDESGEYTRYNPDGTPQ